MVGFRLFEDKAGYVVLDELEGMDSFCWKARECSVAVVETGQDERGDKFGCGIGCEVFPDRTNASELVVAGLSGGANEVLHRE